MNTTSLRSHFLLLCSTRSGYRQSMRFHLGTAIDFNGLAVDEKLAFMRHAIESYGMAPEDLDPDARIEIMAFATEAECRRAYAKLRGDRQGPAPRLSGRN